MPFALCCAIAKMPKDSIWQPLEQPGQSYLEKNVARQTRELKVRKGKLYVYVNTATMRSQLMMVREGIKQRLNEEIGEAYLNEVIVK